MSLIDELQSKVGTEIGVGDWHAVTQEQIDRFAEATHDHQWIHVDAQRAADGPFGTTIAHGFLTLSMLVALAPNVDVPGTRMGINYGLDRVRFTAPVPVGSRIRARSVLHDVREVAGGIQTTVEVTVEIEGAEKPALIAQWLGRSYL
jgi:acyl dehydratase